MIVLDTNVISELWKATPDPNVLAWVDEQAIETLFLSIITVAKLRFGLAVMPAGKRKKVFHARFENEVLDAFAGRIVLFDLDASRAYAKLMAEARSAGMGIATADGYIAATAAVRNFAVATRDASPFQAAGLRTIDPWELSS